MATKMYLIKNGETTNRANKELVITTTEIITPSNINLFLPNNKSRYEKEIKRIPSGSTVQILATTSMIIAIFNEDISEDGEWKAISEVAYL